MLAVAVTCYQPNVSPGKYKSQAFINMTENQLDATHPLRLSEAAQLSLVLIWPKPVTRSQRPSCKSPSLHSVKLPTPLWILGKGASGWNLGCLQHHPQNDPETHSQSSLSGLLVDLGCQQLLLNI